MTKRKIVIKSKDGTSNVPKSTDEGRSKLVIKDRGKTRPIQNTPKPPPLKSKTYPWSSWNQKQWIQYASIAGGALLLILLLIVWLNSNGSDQQEAPKQEDKPPTTPVEQPERKGKKLSDIISIDDFAVQQEGKIDADMSIASFLQNFPISASIIEQLEFKAEDHDIYELEEGKNFVILGSKERSNKPRFLIYTPSIYHHALFKLNDPVQVQLIEREVQHSLQAQSAIIDTSLIQAFEENKIPFSLLGQMEEAMASTLDFFKLERNDRFKIIYEVAVADGQEVEIGQLQAVFFEVANKPYFAFYFDELSEKGYYNQDGRPLKSTFLSSPVKYGRISSPYNAKGRLHPVQKVMKAHLGTDYAAKAGTEIRAVADGVVTVAAFKRNNGNYVKIKHNDTYETQYLHMQGFKKGIKKGVRVKQGDIIGYVGMTGLATGPHVCFRFWKNGKQVDPLKENLVQPVRFNRAERERFFTHRDSLKEKVEALRFFDLLN